MKETEKTGHPLPAAALAWPSRAFALALGLLLLTAWSHAFAQPGAREFDPDAGLSAILLGTGVPLPNPDRQTACTAVIAGDRVFLVDTGRNCILPLDQAGIDEVDGVFYTHYHSDHFIGLGEILLDFGIGGIDRRIPVRGPEGAIEVVTGLLAAYRLDLEYRIAHHGDKFAAAAMNPRVTEHEPGVVLEEDGLRVTMFPVCHEPVEPAVGYRFEFRGEVLVVSGDTRVCPAYAEGAAGADLLISEAENAAMFNTPIALARAVGNTRQLEMIEEGMEYHAETLALARMAQEAGVKKLALTHLFPSIAPTEAAEALFIQGMSDYFDGPIVVGRDGMEVAP